MELARPAVFLFSYFCRGRQSSNGAKSDRSTGTFGQTLTVDRPLF